jgi:hypothetical protein
VGRGAQGPWTARRRPRLAPGQRPAGRQPAATAAGPGNS